VAIPIGQSNRPELVRQTLIPAFPPRVLGSDDAHTGRRREGGATLNISSASSTLSQRARPDKRANARQSSSSRANWNNQRVPRAAGGSARAQPCGYRVGVHANQQPVGQAPVVAKTDR
jgi:hypothetical protein